MNASVEKIEGTTFMDNLPEGKALKINTGFIEIGGSKFESEVENSENFLTVKANISKGSHQLKSEFILQNGTTIPSYYTEIEKL